MPIKELLALSAIILTAMYISNPLHPQQAVRNLEIRILRVARRTDDWGNPSIFQYASRQRHHVRHIKKESPH